jgi:hypothetical protein
MNLVLARSISLAALIVVCLSPVARAASSNSNIGPTQSGPGASGLFTPNSPGNAAAYNAQLTGALEGSPIVDGSGANLHISVPMATPSETHYINYTVGATTPDNRNSYMQDSVQTTNSPLPASNSNITNIHQLVFPPTTTAVRATRIAPIKRSLRADQRLATTTTNLGFRHYILQTRRTPTDPLSLLGKVDGSIEYDDNQIVLFGANGTLRVNNDRSAVLTLTDGRVITYHDPANTMHQLATRHEVQL